MKRNILICLFLLLFISINSLAQGGMVSTSYIEAKSALSLGNYKKALIITNNILEKDSTDLKVLLLKSQIIESYYKDYNTAMSILDRILQLAPDNLSILKSKINLLLVQNKCLEALNILEKIPFESYDEEIMILFVSTMACPKKPELMQTAKNILSSYLNETGSESYVLMDKLATLYMVTDKDSAILYLKKCISLHPTITNFYISTSWIYLTENNNDEAKSILNTGIKNCINNDNLFYWLSKVYFDVDKNIDSSLLCLNTAIEKRKEEKYFELRAEIFDSINRPDLAKADYIFLLNNLPWNLSYLRNVIKYEFNENHFNKVIEVIKNSSKYDEAFSDSCALLLMKSYFSLGNFDSAYKYIDKENVLFAKEFNDNYVRALLLSVHSRTKECLNLCQSISSGKLILNEDQEFKIILLKSLIFLLDKNYDSFYKMADILYQKNNSFIKSIVLNQIKSEKEAKRKITLKANGNSEYLPAVTITESEYQEINKRYNLLN